MADKSKLIDIDGLKAFKANYDEEIDEKISKAKVSKESIIEALGYTPIDESDVITNSYIDGLFATA